MYNEPPTDAGVSGADDFTCLVEGLMQPRAYPHPVERAERIETHISEVLLAGDFAYKLKKPIELGFLDFSTRERRRHFCDEEIRLNRRLAADIYLDVVPITGTPAEPCVGGSGPALEYAVRMRRFPQEALLDRQPLSVPLAKRLAELVADFHASLPIATDVSGFGRLDAVLDPMFENIRQVRQNAIIAGNRARLDRLERWTGARARTLAPIIEQRRRQGYVRECHGDMHRGNIALVGETIHIFDAIEFNPNLRWIDTASEIAFLVMDMEQADEKAAAGVFLNRYLERSGDYGALALLDFYKVYRAMVRAKVIVIRLAQGDLDLAAEAEERARCTRYLELAESYTRPRQPCLLIACGLSGSGKSRLSFQLRETLPLIHVRSDVERKRLFGLDELSRTSSGLDAGIYFPTATNWTYDRLHCLADTILASGYDVLVDATFLSRQRRERFIRLAHRHQAAYAILALDAPLDILRQRVRRRLQLSQDPSEASLTVLERQHASRQCLSDEETTHAVHIDTSCTAPFPEILERLERALHHHQTLPAVLAERR